MNFKEEVSGSAPVLVDFYASWCGPCRMMLPAIEKLAQNHKVVKVNIDEDEGRQLSSEYSINAVPTIIIFKEGQPVKRLVGLQTKETLELALQEAQ